MPATHVQVFGPITVDPGFTSTGEKTLLTMSTTLPAGGKNVIIAVFKSNSAFDTNVRGTFRIKKGGTILYELMMTASINYAGERSKARMLLAVDNNPTGNDTYTFTVNITQAGTATGVVHVQGMVIKTTDASWAYNTTTVSVGAGATATITSMTTTYPANSKVVALMIMYGSWTGNAHKLVGAGNIKLKLGTTIISSNQFNTGSYISYELFHVSLAWYGIVTTSSQTWVAELTNGSDVTFTVCAEIVTFTVYDGALLDTGSVSLTSGTQVTVGNLSTTLSGNVAVIGLAAAEYTATTGSTTFNAGDVVLQKDNSTADQVSNLVNWILEYTSVWSRDGILPLLRYDTNVSSPSYQIKMTARASGINGEAKIVAFKVGTAYYTTLSEILGMRDLAPKQVGLIRSESINLSDVYTRTYTGFRAMSETLLMQDAIHKGVGLLKTEVLQFSDIVEPLRAYLLFLSEVLGLSDSTTRRAELHRMLTESINLSDTFTRTLNKYMTLQERVALADRTVKGINKQLVERLKLPDTLKPTFIFVKNFVEKITLADTSAGYHYRGLPIVGDRPDFTGKAATTIIGQVADLKLIYDERLPLAINIAKMIAEKLTVLAPSLQAVSVGVTKSTLSHFYDNIRPGYYGRWFSITGRGRLKRMMILFRPVPSYWRFCLNELGFELVSERGTPAEKYLIHSVLYSWEVYDGGQVLWELNGTGPGAYLLREYVGKPIKWILIAHDSDSFAGYHDVAVYYATLLVDIELEFENNISFRTTNYSSHELNVNYLVEWGPYP